MIGQLPVCYTYSSWICLSYQDVFVLTFAGKQGNLESQTQSYNVTVPSGIRALQHPDPGSHVFQLPGDVQGNASAPTYQDAGIVWAHLSFD